MTTPEARPAAPAVNEAQVEAAARVFDPALFCDDPPFVPHYPHSLRDLREKARKRARAALEAAAQVREPSSAEREVEAMAEALFFAEEWTDHDCLWADVVAEEETPTRAIVRHFRGKAAKVLARLSPLAREAARTKLWSILDEVRDFFPASDESVGFTPFEDWKLRASKAAALIHPSADRFEAAGDAATTGGQL